MLTVVMCTVKFGTLVKFGGVAVSATGKKISVGLISSK
jgi:hypothetical protein